MWQFYDVRADQAGALKTQYMITLIAYSNGMPGAIDNLTVLT